MNNKLCSDFTYNYGFDLSNVNFPFDTFFLKIVKSKVSNKKAPLLFFFVVVKLEDRAADVNHLSIDKLLDDRLLIGDVEQVNFIFHICTIMIY